MKDIKRLSAVLVALSMLIGNMNAAAVAADEADISEEVSFSQEDLYEDVSDAESETGSEDLPVSEETVQQVGETVSEEQPTEDVSQSEEQQQNDGQEKSESSEQSQPENQENATEEHLNQEQPADFTGESKASAVNNGKGDIEGLVNTKVFQVTLPVEGNSLNYVADPQKLIYKTEAAKHPDSLYDENSNVYFNNGEIVTEDGRKLTRYSGTSNPLKVVNKSSCAVSVVARVRAYYEQGATDPVALAGSRSWDNVAKPSICLSVIKSDDNSEIVLTQHEQIITASIAGCPGAYRYVYETTGSGDQEYSYRLMSDEELAAFRSDPANAGVDSEFKYFSLSMTGECNSDGEWNHRTEYDFPSTSIVWNVGFAVSAKPCINTVDYSVAYSKAIEIPYSLGAFDSAASAIVSAEYISTEGECMQILGNGSYMNSTDEVINLSSELADYVHVRDGGIIRFTFDDPDNTVIDVNLDNNAAPSLDETEFTLSSGNHKLTITYDLGVGNKAATKVIGVSFGSSDFSSSSYSTIGNGKIVLNGVAVSNITMKNGGKVYVTFDDPGHTRCSVKVSVN